MFVERILGLDELTYFENILDILVVKFGGVVELSLFHLVEEVRGRFIRDFFKKYVRKTVLLLKDLLMDLGIEVIHGLIVKEQSKFENELS